MSLKQVLFASGAAIWLVAPVTEVSAQYRYTDRPAVDRQRQDRQVQQRSPSSDSTVRKPVTTWAVQQDARSSLTAKPVEAPRSVETRPVDTVRPVEIAKPVEKPAPSAGLTEEQLAAKAAVDELLARDPALVAAKEIPDPALYRAAVAKHNAEDARKARQEADAARRKEMEARNKARDEAKVAALKGKQDTTSKNAKPPAQTRQDTSRVLAAAPPRAPVRPIATMPSRNGHPLARNL
jgi:hypothetical protein